MLREAWMPEQRRPMDGMLREAWMPEQRRTRHVRGTVCCERQEPEQRCAFYRMGTGIP